jgi:hypothetical protein
VRGILDEAGEALDRAALFLRQRVRGYPLGVPAGFQNSAAGPELGF